MEIVVFLQNKNKVMTVNFYILVKDRKGLYNIEMRCVHNKIRMRRNTKNKVKAEDWDKRKQRVKDSCESAKYVNTELWMARNAAMAFPSQTSQIDNASFVNYMDGLMRPKVTVQANNFDTAMDDFISNIGNRTNSNGETISKGRIENYKRIVSDFKRFESQQGKTFRIEDMTAKTVGAFLDWLRTDRNLAPNTLQGRMKMLRAMLAAITKNHHIHTDYQDVKVKGEVVEHTVLTDDEMNAMMNYDTSGSPRLDNVRKLFIVGICTGLRFSDFSTIKPEHIAKDILTIHQKKTGGSVQIPVHPKLKEILNSGNMPRPICLQLFNKYLRELAQLSGVNSQVEVKDVKGGQRTVRFVPKYKLVSSHICRRSFASRLYRLGVNPQIIMKLTGHKQLSTFMSYIVIYDEDVFQSVKDIW